MSRPILMILALLLSAQALADSAKRKDIRKILDLMNVEQMAQQTLQAQVPIYRMTMPKVEPKIWDEILRQADTHALIESITDVYDSNLGTDEVKGLLEFYLSPAGRKFIAATPKITKEVQAAGQRWGLELAQKAQAKHSGKKK